MDTNTAAIHPHYDHYNAAQIQRLDGFYGLIEKTLHQEITPYIMQGKNILDIGCGFGSLCDFFSGKGFDVTGIEQHAVSLNAGKKRFPDLNLILDQGDFLDKIPDKSFDIIIMKDVIHHVVAESEDIDKFMHNVKRICRKFLVVIDPNPTLILRTSRKIIKHIDPECSPSLAQKLLHKYAFTIKKLFFSEVFAFPLSGGFVGPELIKAKFLMHTILKTDRFIKKIFDWLHVSRFICWRYIVIASPNS